jgi:Domain of unknown function (DUF4337)
MAELEIHTESETEHDPTGQKVGVLAAALAVFLAIVTIASHRTHTEAIILRTEANDRWQFYQSRRIKLHSLELGEDLMATLGSKNDATEKAIEKYRKEKEHYEKQGEEVQAEARKIEAQGKAAEQRAQRYDFGEGLLEIGLVLTSLYFISRKKLFPVVGIVAGIAGIGIAVTGLLL